MSDKAIELARKLCKYAGHSSDRAPNACKTCLEIAQALRTAQREKNDEWIAWLRHEWTLAQDDDGSIGDDAKRGARIALESLAEQMGVEL